MERPEGNTEEVNRAREKWCDTRHSSIHKHVLIEIRGTHGNSRMDSPEPKRSAATSRPLSTRCTNSPLPPQTRVSSSQSSNSSGTRSNRMFPRPLLPRRCRHLGRWVYTSHRAMDNRAVQEGEDERRKSKQAMMEGRYKSRVLCRKAKRSSKTKRQTLSAKSSSTRRTRNTTPPPRTSASKPISHQGNQYPTPHPRNHQDLASYQIHSSHQ